MSVTNPLIALLDNSPFMVLDGALATELEARGCQIADSLWSANALTEHPDIIRQVHLDYFNAGAQCAITASYQASIAGFEKRGITASQAEALMARSAELACEARELFLNQHPSATRPLIAGSIGPYGAYLADGSEYRGDYQLSTAHYLAFHRPRVRALVAAGVDLLACETLPSFPEIKALCQLLQEFPAITAWFSFTLRDTTHLSDGTELSEVITFLNQQAQVVAVGINCIALTETTAALRYLHQLTPLPLIVYPNSGEHYDPDSKTWHATGHGCQQLTDYLSEWLDAGARLIGGCCRTTPADIYGLSQRQSAP